MRIGERPATATGGLLTEVAGTGLGVVPEARTDRAPEARLDPATVPLARARGDLRVEPTLDDPGTAAFRSAVGARMTEVLADGGPFTDAYAHMLSAPGKRLRAAMVVGAWQLRPELPPAPVPASDALDLGCAVEMFHEASLIHDDICDGSPLRRDSASIAAAFGVRFGARMGFHLAGAALRLAAGVFEKNPWVLRRLSDNPGERAHFHRLGDLSFGQIVERLPPDADTDRLRKHYLNVAVAKTGTLFRLGCGYGVALGDGTPDQMDAIVDYADRLAVAFQVMDDIRDIEGAPTLGKAAGSDLERTIPTWPLIEWLDLAPGASAIWRAAVAGQLRPAELESIAADVVLSGATARAHAFAVTEASVACRRLTHAFPDDTAGRRFLLDLCHRVVVR